MLLLVLGPAGQTRTDDTAAGMVTHDTEILDTADRVTALRDGRLT
ncbi:hypothetical protein [Streptomyces sp. NPDC060194]